MLVSEVLVTDMTLEFLRHAMLAGHVTTEVACPMHLLAANQAYEQIVSSNFVLVPVRDSLKGQIALPTWPQVAGAITLFLLHVL